MVGQGQIAAASITGASGCIWSASLLREQARHRYVARNRLLAALADRVVVAWAAQRSGSMHTARFARRLGRPVDAWWDPDDPPANDGCRGLVGADRPAPPLEALLNRLVVAGGVVAALATDEGDSLALGLMELECAGRLRRTGIGRYDIIRRGDG
jgi:hypothetical protein